MGRLRAFQVDYGSRWQSARDDGAVSERWASALAELSEKHFADAAGFRPAGGLPETPPHSPRERVTASRLGDDGARLQTIEGQTFHEYSLVKVDDDWRISRLVSSSTPPEPFDGSPPLVSAEALQSAIGRSSPTARLEPIVDFTLNGANAFSAGSPLDDADMVLEVHTLGFLHLSSGIVGVQDFTCLPRPPLARKLAPGDYPVDLSCARSARGVINVAARIRIGPARPTARWCIAHDIEGSEGGIGVDAANVCIFDYVAFARLTKHARDWQMQALFADEEPAARLLRLGAADDCVAIESGHGDGVYPCYWGTDATGEPTALHVDFIGISSG